MVFQENKRCVRYNKLKKVGENWTSLTTFGRSLPHQFSVESVKWSLECVAVFICGLLKTSFFLPINVAENKNG
jgi:hypothetical protein